MNRIKKMIQYAEYLKPELKQKGSNRHLTSLRSCLVSTLVEMGCTRHEIGKALKKDPSTITTLVHRHHDREYQWKLYGQSEYIRFKEALNKMKLIS